MGQRLVDGDPAAAGELKIREAASVGAQSRLRLRESSSLALRCAGDCNIGMNLHRLPAPLCDLLNQPVPTSRDWDWAVWGAVAEAQLPAASRSVQLVTADDAEPRLLSAASSRWLLPFAGLPWSLGGAIPCSLLSYATTWSQAIAAAEGIVWAASPTRPASVRRPIVAPQWQTASAGMRALIRSALPSKSSAEVTALEAGWLQLADDLNASHQCSQSIEGQGRQQSGDYWHAIMHRREPDYGNSQYWFHQFGRHDVFPKLAEEVPRVAATVTSPTFDSWTSRLTPNGRWDPLAFVACCREAATSAEATFRAAVEELQYREMLLLLRQTFEDAGGLANRD